MLNKKGMFNPLLLSNLMKLLRLRSLSNNIKRGVKELSKI